METTTRQLSVGGDHADSAAWCAIAAALAHELAALRVHLAAMERLLGLSVPTAMPERCHQGSVPRQDNDHPSGTPLPHPLPAGLSRREAEILGLLAAGRSNRAIAHALCLSPRTVQRHVANAYAKIGAHNRAEATVYALRHDLA